jgi:DNA polymerase I-like protein with 3'-5' exonuclease and polymerase domains
MWEATLFNPNSTDQVGELLFERFGDPVSLKRTPGGDPSTNDKILEALEKDSHLDRPVRDLIAAIREYREVYKLKHTFVDKIPELRRPLAARRPHPSHLPYYPRGHRAAGS